MLSPTPRSVRRESIAMFKRGILTPARMICLPHTLRYRRPVDQGRDDGQRPPAFRDCIAACSELAAAGAREATSHTCRSARQTAEAAAIRAEGLHLDAAELDLLHD